MPEGRVAKIQMVEGRGAANKDHCIKIRRGFDRRRLIDAERMSIRCQRQHGHSLWNKQLPVWAVTSGCNFPSCSCVKCMTTPPPFAQGACPKGISQQPHCAFHSIQPAAPTSILCRYLRRPLHHLGRLKAAPIASTESRVCNFLAIST